MLKKIISFFFIFTFYSSFSQNLSFKLFEKLTKIESFSLDEYMVEGYGYKKISEDEESRVYKYGFVQNKNWGRAIVITIKCPKKTGYNIVEIMLGKEYELNEIKKIITTSEGYSYEGVNKDFGLNIYSKNNLNLLTPQKNKEDSFINLILIRE